MRIFTHRQQDIGRKTIVHTIRTETSIFIDIKRLQFVQSPSKSS
ncbi:hypothetical protein EVA_04238 [gut metagenome]|uniref:Uncharacterized protein n=1 Tax=gut metagenome TaxID=749906 RepID=J9D4Q4_9ZZZZ